MDSRSVLGDRAVVIGSSIAGLLAARILSERFAQVWILERDELPAGPGTRKGTPQAGHAHGLLSRGRAILEDLFPGYTDTLCQRGAQLGDGGDNIHMHVGGRELARASTGDVALACSRPMIEDEVRRRVRALPNVQIMTRIDVVEPIFDFTALRVTGVRIRVGSRPLGTNLIRAPLSEHIEDGALAADLVVDCTGRSSRAPEWLASWGFKGAEEERVVVGVTYVTGYFERRVDQFSDCCAVISTADRDMHCPAVLIAQEPEPGSNIKRWVVTLGGYAGDHAECTLVGMKLRALRSGSDVIARVVHESRLLGPVTRFGFPHSQRRRYERLRRFPERFLIMGDAFASFNPIYGQGMTVAATEAMALRALLAGGLDEIGVPFFRRCSKLVDNPWQIAVGADLAIPSVQGHRTIGRRATNAYMRALFRAAERDAVVTKAFRNVTHLVKAPSALLTPNVLWRVLVGNMKPRVSSLPSRSGQLTADSQQQTANSGQPAANSQRLTANGQNSRAR